MEFLRSYAAAVTVWAVLCAVLLSITPRGSHHTLLRFLWGLAFAIVLIRPLTDRKWKWDPRVLSDAVSYGKQQARLGTDLSRDALRQGISRRLEEYILEKADLLGARLSVTVILGEDNLPEALELHGSWDHETKEELSRLIEKDLGIAKENQLWTG